VLGLGLGMVGRACGWVAGKARVSKTTISLPMFSLFQKFFSEIRDHYSTSTLT